MMEDLDKHYYRVSRQAAQQMGFAVSPAGEDEDQLAQSTPQVLEPAGPERLDFELLGQSQGRVVLEKPAGIGAVQAAFNGQGSLVGVDIADACTFAYMGEPRLFAGEVQVVLLDLGGATLARWRGRNVGKHHDAGSAVIHAVGMFETVSRKAPPEMRALRRKFALAQIDLIDFRSYRWSLWRLDSRGPGPEGSEVDASMSFPGPGT